MSGERFQQWSQGSPLLSLDRFHLKQTPVLNFNCRDSLGFPSYILHKKTFFFLGFNPGPVVRKRVFCFWFQRFASLFFSLPKWLALHFQNVCIIFLEFWLEGLGARLGILWDPSRLGSFGGPYFFWDFGNTLNFGGPSFLGRP